jgi:hypothetical protein
MTEDEGRRAKRRCARNKYVGASMPSAIHYVGYVSAAAGTRFCARVAAGGSRLSPIL